MDEFRRRLIHLHHCRHASWRMIFNILKIDPTLSSLYDFPYMNEIPNLSNPTVYAIQKDLHSEKIEEEIRQYTVNGIHTITFFDKNYPTLLKEIYDPPWVLYGSGNTQLLTNENRLAVVGSRQGTEYGLRSIQFLFPKLIKAGLIIVSGLAKGIDTIAHKTAIELGGNTIAVIGGGIFHIYPKANKKLALYMMRKQLVLSEYPPNTPPMRWHFPLRNRIISGLSKGTFVVEAKEKSGTLITAEYSLQEGRDVFALPGSVFSPMNKGTNHLIQQGAKLVMTAEDILEEIFGYSTINR